MKSVDNLRLMRRTRENSDGTVLEWNHRLLWIVRRETTAGTGNPAGGSMF
jgi:hypothetical protein